MLIRITYSGPGSHITDEHLSRYAVLLTALEQKLTLYQISPDGKSAYLAYLDSTYKSVHVQQLDPTTFVAVGTPYVTAAFEAGGLVAHNDGFALLATVTATSSDSSEIPPESYPIVTLIRYQSGAEAVCFH